MTQISPTRICRTSFITESRDLRFKIQGLTLIELIVVIFIISLTTALIAPSFWMTKEDEVKREAKNLSAVLRYVYDEAINKKKTYVFRFNLDENIYSFKGEKESRIYQIKLNEGLKEIITPSLGNVSMGEVIIEFGPLGPVEPIIVHLKEDENEYTVLFNNLTGRTRIYEGYRL